MDAGGTNSLSRQPKATSAPARGQSQGLAAAHRATSSVSLARLIGPSRCERVAAHVAAPAGAASQQAPHHEPADGLPDGPVRPGRRMGGRGGAVIPPYVELCTRAYTHTH
jgi:hypothetical protein